MRDIITIIQTEIKGEQVNSVNARDLHANLEVKSKYADWVKNRINDYNLVEGVHYMSLTENLVSEGYSKNLEKPKVGGRPTTTHYITIDTAKLLSMVERNAIGQKVCEYFIACEKQLKEISPSIDLNNASQLRGLLGDYTEKVLKLEEKIEVDKPKVEAFDQFINSDGLYGLQNAARVIGAKPNLFSRWLKQDFLFYQGSALVAKARYIQMGIFEVKTTIIDDKARPRTFITPKGIEYLRQRVPNDILIENRIYTQQAEAT